MKTFTPIPVQNSELIAGILKDQKFINQFKDPNAGLAFMLAGVSIEQAREISPHDFK